MHCTKIRLLTLGVWICIGVTVRARLRFVFYFVFMVTGEAIDVFVTGMIEGNSEVTLTVSFDYIDFKVIFRSINR